MASRVQPQNFNFGNAFLGGIQQAGEEKRRNAMLDMDQRRNALMEDQFGLQQDRFAQEQAAMQAQSEQAQRQRQAYAQLFEESGLDPGLADTDGADELAEEILRQRIAPPAQPDYKVVGDSLLQIGPDGARPVFTAPKSAPADQKPTLQEITMPDGSIQKMWLRPGETEGPKVGAPAFSRQTQLSPKDLVTARNKLNTVKLARQQLNDIKAKFAPLKGSMSAGPFGFGKIPSEAGNAFDASVNRMRSTLTSLTRVPGVGAMSDYETRLDQAKFPNRNEYESVTEDSLNQLDAMLNAVETGYSDLISQGPVQAQGSADQFEVGKEYTDAQGNKAVYRGNGQWEDR